jgi:hypothetical protein
MPTPENLIAVLDKERSLDRQILHRKAAAVNTFYQLQIPTAVSFSFSEMDVRRMRMIV